MTIAKSAQPAEGDEEFSELVACDFPTMGLVGKGANGIPRFLVMKDADGSATGLLEPEFVRGLIAKAEPEPAPDTDGQVTMTGSPAAIAKMIHEAAVRHDPRRGMLSIDEAQAAYGLDGVHKAEMSAKSKNDLPDSAFAYIESGGKKDARRQDHTSFAAAFPHSRRGPRAQRARPAVVQPVRRQGQRQGAFGREEVRRPSEQGGRHGRDGDQGHGT